MKKAKRIMALVLSIVLCLAMSSMSVFAAADYSITVNGAKAGETYTAYKMLDLSVNDPENPTAYRYTVNSAWTAFAETNEFKAVYTVDAHTISMETLGKYFPNSPMLAAVVKVTGIMSQQDFLEQMRTSYQHKFAKKPEVIDGNMAALERAFQEVK